MYTNDCRNCKHYGTDECSDCVTINNETPSKYEFMFKTHDPVNRPAHYTHGRYECIDVMLDNFGKEAVQHFCLLNAFKYVWRTNYRNGIQDIKKAMKYLEFYLELEGEESAEVN